MTSREDARAKPGRPPAHGFTSVDTQADPAQYVRCQEILYAHPFYTAYKRRIRELVDPQPEGLFLDVGAGAGLDALACERERGARVVALDASLTMAREARRRGLSGAVVADAARLPFPPCTFAACWADRVFQHLASPDLALGELVRVTKPSGRIVVIDPDSSTQAMAFPDPSLAQRVLRFRSEHGLRQGAIAGSMPARFRSAGLDQVRSESRTLVARDASELDGVFGLRTWARSASRAGLLGEEEVARWETLFDATVAGGCFSWQVTFVLTTGVKRP